MRTRKFYIHYPQPLLIRNKINEWELLKYKKYDWCKLFKNKILPFRQGEKIYTQTPYWERLCSSSNMTLDLFFKQSNQYQDNWHYFDYKYMKDFLPENAKLFNEIKWSDIKLFDVSARDTTLWIGNEGAHTPCHMDTYGCNFVAQILGRKLWILIPPEETENLNPIRVPYEESTIYSSYNFYTPNNDLLKIKKAYKIILSPGEVLFVPRHWWHYVENLEVAISINVWVPMENDHESRLEESLVRNYISNICKDLTEEEAKLILNPNEYDLLKNPSSFTLIQTCLENIKTQSTAIDTPTTEEQIEEVELETLNIKSYIKEKSQTFNYNVPVNNKTETNQTNLEESNHRISFIKKLINSYCQPKNVAVIKNSLLNQFLSSDELCTSQTSADLEPKVMRPQTSSRNIKMNILPKTRLSKRKKTRNDLEGKQSDVFEIKGKRKRKRIKK